MHSSPPGVVRASWTDPGTPGTLGTPHPAPAAVLVYTGCPAHCRGPQVAVGLTPGCTGGKTGLARSLPR